MATSPARVAATRRAGERVGRGARMVSSVANADAVSAVRVRITPSHSGRLAHHAALLGSGSVVPVTMANRATPPAMASSSGMCQR